MAEERARRYVRSLFLEEWGGPKADKVAEYGIKKIERKRQRIGQLLREIKENLPELLERAEPKEWGETVPNTPEEIMEHAEALQNFMGTPLPDPKELLLARPEEQGKMLKQLARQYAVLSRAKQVLEQIRQEGHKTYFTRRKELRQVLAPIAVLHAREIEGMSDEEVRKMVELLHRALKGEVV